MLNLTLNTQHSTLNTQHSTFNIEHSTLNIQHSPYTSAMRRLLITITILAAAGAASAQSTFAISGFLTGRAERANGPTSWLEGGFGRLDAGDSKTREFATL